MDPASQSAVVKEAAKAIGVVAPAVYQDALQPAAREMGQQLVIVAKAVGVALAPLRALVWSYEQMSDYLSATLAAKLARKPVEEIQTPGKVIAGPVLMGMAFAEDAPHLREMYANLLAAAMHTPSAGKAHPSFVQTIQQLSPDEARILQEIARTQTSANSMFEEEEDPNRKIPGEKISDRWRLFCSEYGIQERVLADAYCENLIRLGILRNTQNSRSKSSVSAIGYRVVTTHRLELTHYGDLFLEACVREI